MMCSYSHFPTWTNALYYRYFNVVIILCCNDFSLILSSNILSVLSSVWPWIFVTMYFNKNEASHKEYLTYYLMPNSDYLSWHLVVITNHDGIIFKKSRKLFSYQNNWNMYIYSSVETMCFPNFLDSPPPTLL